jgi:hypothetical protein
VAGRGRGVGNQKQENQNRRGTPIDIVIAMGRRPVIDPVDHHQVAESPQTEDNPPHLDPSCRTLRKLVSKDVGPGMGIAQVTKLEQQKSIMKKP